MCTKIYSNRSQNLNLSCIISSKPGNLYDTWQYDIAPYTQVVIGAGQQSTKLWYSYTYYKDKGKRSVISFIMKSEIPLLRQGTSF